MKIKDYFAYLAAFLPPWVIVMFLVIIAIFVAFLIIRFIGFILDAIPFL